MTYGSVCSGIEAASVAWIPLGFKPAFYSEVDPFCRAVLQHHYADTKLYGDFTAIPSTAPGIDVLVGGTPCQSFSIAGLRGGLDDDRGNLALEFCRLADRLRPRWFVWENVPGVLSSNGGRDFGSILGAMGELGYGTAYRILDAQHFGIPQRRRRVFVVGHLGDWRLAAAVLFERFSLSGHPPPRREAGKGFTHDIAPSLTSSGRGVERGGDSRGQDPVVAMALNANGGSGRIDAESETFVTDSLRGHPRPGSNSVGNIALVPETVGAMSAAGGTDRKHGHGWGQQDWESGYAIPILEAGARTGTSTTDPRAGIGIGESGDPMFTLQSGKQHAVAFTDQWGDSSDITSTIKSGCHGALPMVASTAMRVRRLTPRECERLQGFPDDYTNTPYRGKPAADGPRYKSLGNSMAVPVMRWIGERIQAVEALNI